MNKSPQEITHPSELLPAVTKVAVAMGVFDGVHLGHQAILSNLVEWARANGACPVALTFAPHPKAVLAPPPPLSLATPAQQARLMGNIHVQYLIRLSFTRELAALSPQDFLTSHFLLPGLQVTAFCIGENWRFGRNNSGDAKLLAQWSSDHGISASIVPCVKYAGEVISSTRIRHAIATGDLTAARHMLGRPYAISGVVRHGLGLANEKLHCPTANLYEPEQATPPEGVYAVSAELEDGRVFPGIAYAGRAPTLRSDGQFLLEPHLFGLDEEIHGKHLAVSFLQFIRPSRKFASPSELQEQIKRDLAVVKALFPKCSGLSEGK